MLNNGAPIIPIACYSDINMPTFSSNVIIPKATHFFQIGMTN